MVPDVLLTPLRPVSKLKSENGARTRLDNPIRICHYTLLFLTNFHFHYFFLHALAGLSSRKHWIVSFYISSCTLCNYIVMGCSPLYTSSGTWTMVRLKDPLFLLAHTWQGATDFCLGFEYLALICQTFYVGA